MDSIGGGSFSSGQLGLFRFAHQTMMMDKARSTGVDGAPATTPQDLPAEASPPVAWQDQPPSRDARPDVTAMSWRERADAADATFAQQMAQIRAAPHAPTPAGKPPPETAIKAGHAHSGAELEALLANFATPADANGDHRISAMEALKFSASLAPETPALHRPAKMVSPVAPPLTTTIAERIAALATESYQAMRSLPQAPMATGSSAIRAAV